MKILFVASECVPFVKVGGLADVVGTLPKFLAARGHDVRVVIPRYRRVDLVAGKYVRLPGTLIIPMGGGSYEEGVLYGTKHDGIPIYAVDNGRYFDRPEVYGTPDGDYGDNRERFVFFCRAALEAAKSLGFKPDVVHCHDWQTGLIPAYLKTVYRIDAFFARTASVFTVHNLAYQGMFDADTVEMAGFSRQDFTLDKLEFYGKFNFMKVGLVYGDLLSTVSPTYAREIQQQEFGCGMDGILRARHHEIAGIVNGIDRSVWEPGIDPLVPVPYTRARPEGKKLCKRALQEACGLKTDDRALLVGAVSRLDPQKGYDLVGAAVPKLAKMHMQLVILGRGDRRIQETLLRLAAKYAGTVSVVVDFDERRAHQIYAGADAFLMPSRFEPCGLGQMIALAYGTVPIVTKTGGLADTVTDFDPRAGRGNGFVLATPDAAGLVAAVGRAASAFNNPSVWKKIMTQAFSSDNSWHRSVPIYERVYHLAAVKRGASA